MILCDTSVARLEEIFRSRFGDLVSVYGTVDEEWTEFLEKYNCVLMNDEDIKNRFQDIINFDSCIKNGICLVDPLGSEIGVEQYVIVPREFAEKLLVLGGFPD